MENAPKLAFRSGKIGGSCHTARFGIAEKTCFHCGLSSYRVEFDSIELPIEMNRHFPPAPGDVPAVTGLFLNPT